MNSIVWGDERDEGVGKAGARGGGRKRGVGAPRNKVKGEGGLMAAMLYLPLLLLC